MKPPSDSAARPAPTTVALPAVVDATVVVALDPLWAQSANPPLVILDFQAVVCMDQFGLEALLDAIAQHVGGVQLVNLSDSIRHFFVMHHLDALLTLNRGD